jgi:hypothetical protein
METCKLRNGSEELKPLVIATRMALESLLKGGGIRGMTQFYDIVMACRDPEYLKQIFPENLRQLQEFGLIEQGGTIRSEIRNIVVSSVEGEGLDMVIVNPIARS